MLQRLVVLLFALGLGACSSLPINALMPKISVTEIGIKRLGLFEQHYDVEMRLTNPNDFDLRIVALDYDLEVNGQAFAKGTSHTPMLIPAASSIVVRVDAITQSKDLFQQFITLSPEAVKQGFPYRLKGRVKTNKWSGWLPFEQKGVYGGETSKPKGIAI
jgi:LEA14-like dessication related protein